MLRIVHKWDSKNRPPKIKIIMKNPIFHIWPRNVPGAPRWCGVAISWWFPQVAISGVRFQVVSQGQIQSMECRAPLVITNTISVLVTFEKDRVNACSLSTVFNNGTAADGQIPTCDRLSTAYSVSCRGLKTFYKNGPGPWVNEVGGIGRERWEVRLWCRADKP